MALVRLQKFISECGVCSRRAAEELIQAGKVKVNGQVVTALGSKIEAGSDRVEVRGRFIQAAPKGILLFHKPRGVVATLADPEGRRTVADYLTKHYESYFPVGRLDYDSSGLLILTNDGELAERLLHPRYGHLRTYHVRVEGRVSESALRKIERGVKLEDGLARAVPVVLETDEKSTWLQLTVAEGRNRLIRRLMERVEHPVMKLRRISHGPFRLGTLRPGGVKKLSDRDYRFFRQKVMGQEAQLERHPNRGESARQHIKKSLNGGG